MEPRTSYFPSEFIERILHKVLCKIGIHTWAWNLSDVGVVYLDDNTIPDCAYCKYCGIKYKND